MDARCLDKTVLLDYDNEMIQNLIGSRGWASMEEYQKIGEIYDYVQNHILFGYNERSVLSASGVLAEGIGQSNTKAVLLMALLRGVDVPCRLHGFTATKKVHQGIIPGVVYKSIPDNLLHSWVEVCYHDKWIALEGVTLDLRYLKNLQGKNRQIQGLFCGYGVADNNFQHPKIAWDGTGTYIQKEGISHDYGTFNSPDAFFKKYPQSLNAMQKAYFQNIGWKQMNRRIQKIRDMKYADQQEENKM